MLKEIPKSNISVRPIRVFKEWFFGNEDIEVHPYFGKNITGSVFDEDTDETTRDGVYKRILFNSIQTQFYRNSATASILTEVGLRKNYSSTYERNIEGDEIAVVALNPIYYGEGIKVGSVVVDRDGILLTDDSGSNLIDSGSNIKGNIFYDRGLIVFTHDVISGSFLTDFSLSYRSTKTIYENEILCSVLEGEFNTSQNPSAVYEVGGQTVQTIINRPGSLPYLNDFITSSYYNAGAKYTRNSQYPFTSSFTSSIDGSELFYSFDDYFFSSSVDPTGSYLAPYVTSIGLYDNENNMVAVAKLPRPIKCLPDYPLNFLVRFDT
jgi:hypothetical protein